MKREKFKLPENDIPKATHKRAERVARALFNTPPITQKELQKKISENKRKIR